MNEQIEPNAPGAERRKITNVRDLLTPDQQAVLDEGLQESAQARIRAVGALAVNQDRY